MLFGDSKKQDRQSYQTFVKKREEITNQREALFAKRIACFE